MANKLKDKGRVRFITNKYEFTNPNLFIGSEFSYSKNDYNSYYSLLCGLETLDCDLNALLAMNHIEILPDREYSSKEEEELYTMGYRDG